MFYKNKHQIKKKFSDQPVFSFEFQLHSIFNLNVWQKFFMMARTKPFFNKLDYEYYL
jgi:hypothetical protein